MSIIITEDIRKSATIPCDFCDEFSGGRRNTFATLYAGQLSNRIVFTTPNFRVIPSLGQIVEGYLLVVPVRHYRALGDMPHELTSELAELVGCVRAALSKAYGPSVLFEHGTRAENSGGCGIYHAHLHAVPFSGARDPIEVIRNSLPYRETRSLAEIEGETNGAPSYLYYEDLFSRAHLFEAEHLPSQYMRRLLAGMLGVDLWDWRKFGKEDALISTMQRLSQAFASPSGRPHQAQE